MGKTILTNLQDQILSLVSNDQFFPEHFYLTGGTALSEYYLRHRFSEDLDFFSEQEVDMLWLSTLSKKIKQNLKAEKVDFQQSFNRNLIFITVGKEVVKTEFTYFPFTQIKEPAQKEGIRVDSIIDIAVNKFFAIYQNPSARHFIDLYLILHKKFIAWEKLSVFSQTKFDTAIDPIQLGSQLIMAQEVQDIPRMIISLDENTWRNFFYKKAKELKKEIERVDP